MDSSRSGFRAILAWCSRFAHAAWEFIRYPRVRIVRLKGGRLREHRYAEVDREDCHSIIDDLVAFTGLDETKVRARVRRTPETHFESEFRWVAPRDEEELTWFYRASPSYLFANASHPYWRILDRLTPESGRVLDYGGGVGNNVIALAERGIAVDYLDVSLIEQAFVAFRAERRGLKVDVIPTTAGGRFDAVACVQRRYGAIVLQDVLEHVPDYPRLLTHLIGQLESGGLIIENSPFEEHSRDIDIHIRESVPLAEAMIGMERIEPHVWRKVASA